MSPACKKHGCDPLVELFGYPNREIVSRKTLQSEIEVRLSADEWNEQFLVIPPNRNVNAELVPISDRVFVRIPNPILDPPAVLESKSTELIRVRQLEPDPVFELSAETARLSSYVKVCGCESKIFVQRDL
jgi:hypothetical protein